MSVSLVSFFNPILYIYLFKNFSLSDVGLYLALFWLSSFLTEIPCGAITDVIGERKSIFLSGLFRILGILMILSSSYTLLLFSAFLSGISESFYSGTLSSWLIKDLNLSQDRDILEHIFSKASIIGLLAALVIGTLSADVLYKYNTDLPFYFSILFSIILIVSVIKSPIKDFKNKKISFKNTFKYSYGEIKTIFKQIMTSKKSIVFILFLLLPKVIDIGPSN
ncbi:MFS transporter [Facklamia sp. P13064]|uniref:MFS transporter n=1 Tax=unclassified Facklamia TaxID=2622293 RepID=UPI003D173ACA